MSKSQMIGNLKVELDDNMLNLWSMHSRTHEDRASAYLQDQISTLSLHMGKPIPNCVLEWRGRHIPYGVNLFRFRVLPTDSAIISITGKSIVTIRMEKQRII